MRYATLISLSSLHHIWTLPTTSKAHSTLLLCLCLVLYDALNDDDDEIRDLAALTATNLFTAQGFLLGTTSAVPVLTSHRLAAFLIYSFPLSKHLGKSALCRLLGTSDLTLTFSAHGFQDVFASTRQEDMALFVQEKQNLFRDESTEVLLWSRVLKKLGSGAVTKDLIDGLESWVLEGLAVLTETAKKETDGALGWSSKPEVFVLGLRVIYGARVLLKWAKGEMRCAVRAEELRKRLRVLGDVGIEAEMHYMWMRQVDKILEEEVLWMLRDMKVGMSKVLNSVGLSQKSVFSTSKQIR